MILQKNPFRMFNSLNTVSAIDNGTIQEFIALLLRLSFLKRSVSVIFKKQDPC